MKLKGVVYDYIITMTVYLKIGMCIQHCTFTNICTWYCNTRSTSLYNFNSDRYTDKN